MTKMISLRMVRFFIAVLVLFHKLVCAATLTIGVLGIEDDGRYQTRKLERNYLGHASGRQLEAATLAVEESASEIQAVGHKLVVRSFMAANSAGLPSAIAQLKAAKVQYVLLDLPDTEMKTVLASESSGAVILFNTSSTLEELRGAGCTANLLHTYPSETMLSDALAQYLAARSWTQTLVLSGPLPKDKLELDAFVRSSKRYGIKINKSTLFKLSSDPREREQSNVRLLTNEKGADVVVVLDSDGEFARGVPYNTQLPRPALGSNGLAALAWHAQWDQNGGPQLTRRFHRLAHRPMTGQDWAAWVAVKAVVSVLADNPKATITEQLKKLRGGQVFVDGFKGPRLSFRPWNGQLRQPVFLASADGVAAVAPFEGVMHPTEVLDTLGVDEKENQCHAQLP